MTVWKKHLYRNILNEYSKQGLQLNQIKKLTVRALNIKSNIRKR